MKVTDKHNERVAKMAFASVYPLYVNKVDKKDRTKEALHRMIECLMGFDALKLEELISENLTKYSSY